MTTRIRTNSLVVAQHAALFLPRHAVPVLSAHRSTVLPGHAAPLLRGRRNHFASSGLFLTDAGLSVGVELPQPASEASASASTSAPRAISSGEVYSSGRWLYPLRQGINNIAIGAIRDIKSES